ncbi:MAG: ABC transporter ATP-binding protein [Lautropia sp.]|nr:ABC transporter ATP-binding protein [Lautropia sp.]
MMPTLAVQQLRTHFFTKAGVVKAVDGVDFSVMPGQIMGLVGESGSGKSMTGYSIIGLVDAPGRIVEGRILLKGEDLRPYSPQQLRAIRGNRIAMIFQDPMMTLNPVLRIDTQMMEAITAHHRIGRSAARERAREALVRVGIPSPEERLSAYPHQFSGGMRQRVAIAIALLNKPDLILCDEPTTALDVTIQGQILFEMQKLCRESGTSLIWITHDLSVVAGLADTVSVMYAGRIVESGTVEAVLEAPRHPYTAGLIASTPAAATRLGHARGQPLAQIPGMTPSLLKLPAGCAFRERCNRASAICMTEPPLVKGEGASSLRCFHPIVAAPTAASGVRDNVGRG